MRANPFHKETILSRVEQDNESRCWNWQSYKTVKGYGAVNVRMQAWSSHRLAFTLWKGEITAGMHVLHRCDNSSCCNPAHLYEGTNLQNSKDLYERGDPYFVKGQIAYNRTFTEDQIRDIRKGAGEKRYGYLVGLAEKYGVTKTTICRIVKRQCYPEVN